MPRTRRQQNASSSSRQVDSYFRKRRSQPVEDTEDTRKKVDVIQKPDHDDDIVDVHVEHKDTAPVQETAAPKRSRKTLPQKDPEQPALFQEVGYKVQGTTYDLTDEEMQVVEHIQVSCFLFGTSTIVQVAEDGFSYYRKLLKFLRILISTRKNTDVYQVHAMNEDL